MTSVTPAIGKSAENLQEATENLQASAAKIGQHIDDLNESISQFMGQLGGMATSSDQKLQQGLDEFGRSAAALTEIADRIDGLVIEIESGRGTLGRLITDESGYERFDETVAAGKRAVEDVTSITSNIKGKLGFLESLHTRKEYELSYDSLSESLQNQFKLSLTRFDPYLYAAGLSVIEDELVYDLQVGRRFGKLTPWVGSVRSKSSIGLDYWPFPKRLGFSLEAIDVRGGEPEWDLDADLRLFGSWYVTLGARDLAAGSKMGLNLGLRAVLDE
jgi:hypothetical protein